jgi:hypothetical protein
MSGTTQSTKKPTGLGKLLVYWGLFLAFDIFFIGAPMLGVYVGLALVLWFIPRIFTAWRQPELRRDRARSALVIAAVLALDCGAYLVMEAIAEKRVVEVANALARYKSERNSYPFRLQDLVPAYLPAIPSAKPLALMSEGPIYLYQPGEPLLMYTSIPPLGRRVLNVVTREWTEVD